MIRFKELFKYVIDFTHRGPKSFGATKRLGVWMIVTLLLFANTLPELPPTCLARPATLLLSIR